ITVRARVRECVLRRTRRRNFSIVTALLDDGSSAMRAVFFNRPYLQKTLARGVEAIFHGKVDRDPISGGVQLDNPQFELVAENDAVEPAHRLVPIHESIAGLAARPLRALLQRLLDDLRELDMPE